MTIGDTKIYMFGKENIIFNIFFIWALILLHMCVCMCTGQRKRTLEEDDSSVVCALKYAIGINCQPRYAEILIDLQTV